MAISSRDALAPISLGGAVSVVWMPRLRRLQVREERVSVLITKPVVGRLITNSPTGLSLAHYLTTPGPRIFSPTAAVGFMPTATASCPFSV